MEPKPPSAEIRADVWVDGRRVVANYRSTMVDEERLFAQIEAAAPAIIARAGKTIPCDWPVS